jgi:hypothetical protein
MTCPRTDPQAALDFLRRWDPDGLWVLTAIAAEQRAITTRTFVESDAKDLLAWVAKQNETRNLYFHVNPVTGPLTKKAERQDIRALAWLHVDIDPRAGEDLELEQRRALKLLTEKLPAGVPAPTVIVFSGGGYQGFWRLSEPFPIDGDVDKAEEAKRWNQQLELVFGADQCHNVDRLMRLPGTVNIPNEKKRAKGRTEQLAQVVEWDESRVYPLSRFTPAVAVQAGSGPTGGGNLAGAYHDLVKLSGNIQPVSSTLDELPAEVSNRTKAIIVRGYDPEEPQKYRKPNSNEVDRSAALFAVLTALVRAGVEDDVMYSIITDERFGISECVLERRRPEEEARRQIGKAKLAAGPDGNPMLADMNEKHAVIGDMGGKCRVISEVWDPSLERWRISRQTKEDVLTRYMNQMVDLGTDDKGRPIRMPLGKWWMQHPLRRQYDTIVFAPGRKVKGNAYNLWRGFNCSAVQGDCDLYLDLLRNTICSGNQEHYEYLLGWMARAVQIPYEPGHVAVVLQGEQGTGKGTAILQFGTLWGHHFVHVSSSHHFTGQFNAHLRDCAVLFPDEAFFAGDPRHISTLKAYVTEPTIMVEPKGVDSEVAPNCLHILMASNDDHVIPAALEERRFFVLRVSSNHKQDTTYFEAIRKQMDNGGREALLYLLLNLDISKFNVRDVPKTDALREQKLHTMKPVERWWYSKLQDGTVLPKHGGWRPLVHVEELALDYANYLRGWGISSTRRGNSTAVGQLLKKAIPGGPTRKQQPEPLTLSIGGTDQTYARPWAYVIPPLKKCREHWDEHYGGPYEWETVMDAPDDEQKPFA